MAETIFKKVDLDVRRLVDDIELGKLGLPDIQRPFVWTNVKVRDLFDSMYRGFPVGYLLLWETAVAGEQKTIGASGKQLTPDRVIVDGQQRLTSLFAVFKGQLVIRSDFQEERIRIAFNPLTEAFEVPTAATVNDRAFIPDISKLWTDDATVFDVRDSYLGGLREVRDVSTEDERRIERALSRLHGLISFPVVALELAAEVSDEEVAEVFVRINSKGTPLKQADFILTLMSVYWDEGRAALEEFARNAAQPSEGGRSSFNWYIKPKPDQLLRASISVAFKRARLAAVHSVLRGKDLEAGTFSPERRAEQFDRLKQAQEQVLNLQYWHDFLQSLRLAGYRSERMINSETALIYSYALYLIGRTEVGVASRDLQVAIAQWFLMASLTGRYSGSPESVMESDLDMVADAADADDFLARLSRACSVALTQDFWEVTLPNDLANSAGRSPSMVAYEAALVVLRAPVLFSNFTVAEMLDPAVDGHRKIERHHLFPRAFLIKEGIAPKSRAARITNQIANYAYVEWQDNVAIADRSPMEYWPEMLSRAGVDGSDDMLRLHALPTGWEKMDYNKFLEHRRELIAAIIREGYERISSSNGGTALVDAEPTLEDLIASGEGDSVEFKSTLRTNLHTGKRDKRMEQAVIKAIAGFLNSDGGKLMIGVADDGTPIGIEADGFASEDKMNQHLANLVSNSLGDKTWALIHVNFEDYQNSRVLVVRCERSPTPVYAREGDMEHFYVRAAASTRELPVSQVSEYIEAKFGARRGRS